MDERGRSTQPWVGLGWEIGPRGKQVRSVSGARTAAAAQRAAAAAQRAAAICRPRLYPSTNPAPIRSATPPRPSPAALRSLTVMHWVGGEPTRWTQWMAGARLLGAVSPVAVVAVGAGIETVAGTLLAVGVFGVLLDPFTRPFAWARDEVAGREQTFTIPQEQDR